jgi:hypothetical protein
LAWRADKNVDWLMTRNSAKKIGAELPKGVKPDGLPLELR